ncbi:MAG: BlaI/MecI/CopY family transcriptional regulator [Bacteroidia bacterium]|nr:BlaI/MecI/CopY family transcriptional regulator [Bacteroidia bacterium]
MQKLTRAEEEIMQAIWRLGKCFMKDLMDALPEPKPAQSTVATLVRILESKGFVAHHAYGKVFEYYPLVERDAYMRFYLGSFVQQYFGGSFTELMRFFHRSGDLDLRGLDELMQAASGEPSDDERHA